jgi:outer membrane protein assembly factor BamB
MTSSAIFIGIRGDVVALDRGTGRQLWKTDLKGADFVNLLLDNDRVIAATKGEVFCLDAATDQVLWHNELPGSGWGLVHDCHGFRHFRLHASCPGEAAPG